MPSITRRQLVGGSAALAVGGYGSYRLLDGASAAAFDAWEPDEGTWPLARYDPANTAYNPHAEPPRETPERRRVTSVRYPVRPLVGDERIVLYGSTLASYAPGTDDVTYIAEDEVPHAGLGPDGTLHSVQRVGEAEPEFEIVSDDGTGESDRFSIGDDRPEGVTVGTEEAYVGTVAREIHAAESGQRDWQVAGQIPALADGRLYATGAPDGVVAYEERTGVGRALSPGPKRRWTGRQVPGAARAPAVADGRLVAGSFYGRPPFGSVAGYDADTGDRLWEPLNLGLSVATPALVGDRGFAAVGTDGLEAGRVVALDVAAGDVRWEDATNWYAHTPVVGGETLVVLGDVRSAEGPGAGVVRAYDTTSGEELWTVAFDIVGPNYGGVALVGERIYVTVGTTLFELV